MLLLDKDNQIVDLDEFAGFHGRAGLSEAPLTPTSDAEGLSLRRVADSELDRIFI